MTEQIKAKNTSTWMLALKQYNEGKQWLVPKRGTPEYEAVKKISDEIKLTIVKSIKPVEPSVEEQPPVKKVRKVRIMNMSGEAPVKKSRRKKIQPDVVSTEDDSSYN